MIYHNTFSKLFKHYIEFEEEIKVTLESKDTQAQIYS